MLRTLLVSIVAASVFALSSAFAQGQFGTATEAKAMLDKAVTAIKADKTKALDQMQKGEGGLKDRDLYAFCANASDGIITAHPTLTGKNIRDIKDKNGKALGEEMMKVAAEGKVEEVSYMWPRPGADATPVEKVTFVTKAADQVCGVGYYK
jgi:signal transduction histidine kinase